MTPQSRPVNQSAPLQRVLLADDSIGMRVYLKTIMSAVGFACTEARDGAEAFDLILANDFDLVITDLDMPRMTGLELLAAIQLLPPGKARPRVVVCSARLDERSVERRPELQFAAALIDKPATAKDILDAAEKALAVASKAC